MTLKDIIRFNHLLLDFQKVERMVYIPGTDRKENDVEHSYQLVMLAWYVIRHGKFPFDMELVIKYALVHDFVEVYAGDVFFYASAEERAAKEKREAQAAERLREEYPEFAELHELIGRYEEQGDKESKFVKALDKMVPILNIYANKGRTWREQEVTLDMLVKKKQEFFKNVPELDLYFRELVEELQTQPELFGNSK